MLSFHTLEINIYLLQQFTTLTYERLFQKIWPSYEIPSLKFKQQ